MKKVFKFVNAGIFLLSMLLIFVNCVEVNLLGIRIDISMFDLTKLGLELDSALKDVISSGDAIFWAVLTIIISVGAFLGFIFSLLPPMAAYIFDILFAIGSGLVVIATYGLHIMVQSESYSGTYNVKHPVFLLWIILFVVIFVLSIVGLASKKKKKDVQPLMQQQQMLRQQINQPQMTQHQSADIPNSKPEEVLFFGAVNGKSNRYSAMSYPMQKDMMIYFVPAGDIIAISPYQEEDRYASLYYVVDKQEYRLTPMNARTVFLASGQPLGMGREYYLPRGTEIYLKDEMHSFILV